MNKPSMMRRGLAAGKVIPRRFFFTLLTATAFVSPFSSNAASLQFGAGAKAGLGMGTLSGRGFDRAEEAVNTGLALGFTGFGLLSVDFIGRLGAEAQIGYAVRGEKWSDKGNGNNYLSLRFDCLETSLLIKGMLPFRAVTPMLYAGPSLGFPLAATWKLHTEEMGIPRETASSVPGASRSSTEWGLATGCGAAVAAGPGALVIDLRYRLGLTDICRATELEKHALYYDASDYESKSGTFSVMVGYIFKL